MKFVYQELSDQVTPRTCAISGCSEKATQVRFKPDMPGPEHVGIDKSSKQYVCTEHGSN
jgi:hypothetical protein